MADASESLPLMTVVERAFAPEECDQIVAMGNSRTLIPGKVNNSGAPDNIALARNAEVGSFPLESGFRWIYERMINLALGVNQQSLGFELEDTEELQFLAYGPGQHYDWHVDIGPNELSRRKLSAVAVLSSPAAYDGGELEFQFGDRPEVTNRNQGSMVVFPSYVLHRVRPVSRGRRFSLALWLRGARPFR